MTYALFGNHWIAMSVVAKDLSDDCGLAIFADRIWVGGGSIALGMVFEGIHMGVDNRTPEDDQKLKKLEENLARLKLMSTPKLEILCSCTYRPHLNEPFHIGLLPPPKTFNPGEILESIKYRRRQSRREHKRERRKNARASPYHVVSDRARKEPRQASGAVGESERATRGE